MIQTELSVDFEIASPIDDKGQWFGIDGDAEGHGNNDDTLGEHDTQGTSTNKASDNDVVMGSQIGTSGDNVMEKDGQDSNTDHNSKYSAHDRDNSVEEEVVVVVVDDKEEEDDKEDDQEDRSSSMVVAIVTMVATVMVMIVTMTMTKLKRISVTMKTAMEKMAQAVIWKMKATAMKTMTMKVEQTGTRWRAQPPVKQPNIYFPIGSLVW
ncbi:hypothetical protein BDN71DRAFT_1432487 [Pleurotus eryngii]|uniref:Uncharacterized protein n=1 Tax=Pleurotus eryngii TaxID=5323 RepID=A0A9P5ZXC7_PLEER|nr:hypothetical protein BDN71DRAFT_1432487 [Pleurotus eryngii]